MTTYEQAREMFRRLDTPPTSEELREWLATRLVAEIWCCGDELDGLCYQAQITRKSPNRRAGYPWLELNGVWQGTFINEPTHDEIQSIEAELREAAQEYGIEVVEREGYWPHGVKVES